MTSEEAETAPAGGLQVVARSARILRMFDAERTDVRINDVAAELGIGRTSAYRYLQSLSAEGFLARVNENDYRLGPLILGLAASMTGRADLLEVAGPELERLAGSVRQTAVLGIWSGSSAVAVACKEPSGKSVNMTVRIGAPLGPDSAQGLAFATWGSDEVRARSLREAGDRADAVLKAAEEARDRGYTHSAAVLDGVDAVAVPIRDVAGVMVGTLALVAPTGVLDASTSSPHVAGLRQVAADLSSALGAPVVA